MEKCGMLEVIRITCLLSVIISISTGAEEKNASSWELSRRHVSVWFDYSVRYYDHEADNAYTKDDLTVMVDLVSTRFGQIVIAGAPVVEKLPLEEDKVTHSRILIPSVVAEHNERNSDRKMKVVVTFDIAKLARTEEVTSFDVAKYMADLSNEIHPGTVDTLMMDTGYSFFNSYFNTKDSVEQLKVAREKINGEESKFGYALAIFMDLRDCGHFKGSLGQKAKDYLPHVETIALLFSPNYHHLSFSMDVLHKMFITKFEDCERKLKKEKPEVKVIPAALWLSRRSRGSVAKVLQGWQMMSKWAEKNNREVILFEAFDTPHGHLISDQGWWKLKDKAEHKISRDGFVEKIEEVNLNYSKSDSGIIYSLEENSDEDDASGSFSSVSKLGKKLRQSESHSESVPNAVYIVLLLLSVVCTLLVAVIAGLVYGFHTMVVRGNNNSFYPDADARNATPSSSRGLRENRRRRMSHGDDDDGSMMCNGSILEVRDTDTAPIIAVTYKK